MSAFALVPHGYNEIFFGLGLVFGFLLLCLEIGASLLDERSFWSGVMFDEVPWSGVE
jgi:hypothetical protein